MSGLFQKIDYALEVRNTPDEKPFWQNIDLVLMTVNEFINKINENWFTCSLASGLLHQCLPAENMPLTTSTWETKTIRDIMSTLNGE